MTIDYLRPQDLQGLKELYEDGFEGSKTDLAKMLTTYELIKNNSNYNILCAKEDNKIVGSVMGVVCYELFGNCLPFLVVENVAVLNSYRRKGIAKQLMVKLEERAIQLKCSMIIFVSSEHRTGAHKLYESLGFGVDKVNGYRKRLTQD
jgi:ribosomal protein S18 acetylase RimI-like enzyme